MSNLYSNGKSGKGRVVAWTTKDSVKIRKGSAKVTIPKPKAPQPPKALKPRW